MEEKEKKSERQFSKESIYCGLAVIIGLLLYINEVNSFLDFVLSGVAYFFVILVFFEIGVVFSDALERNRASSTLVYYLKLVAMITVIVVVTFAIISATFGSTTKIQERRAEEQQELIAAEREEAFAQGAEKAVDYIQEYIIEDSYDTESWFGGDAEWFDEICEEEGIYFSEREKAFLASFGYSHNSLYSAMCDVMSVNGASMVGWQIELDD